MIWICLTLLLTTGVLGWFAYGVYWLNQTAIYAENGILENTQVAVLILTTLLFLTAAIQQRRQDKLVLLFLVWLCASFILREVDVEDFALPNIFILLGSGIGRNIMLATGYISIAIYAWRREGRLRKLYFDFVLSGKFALLISAIAMLFMGQYFEEQSNIKHNTFLEEIMELLAYVTILILSLLCTISTNDTTYKTPSKHRQ